jgi:RNA-directed DNA polymerase
MQWRRYKRLFVESAQKASYDSDYIDRCLTYAKKLNDQRLPILYDQEHFAAVVGYTPEYLRRASNDPENFYRYFTIPKKSGGSREIAEPLPSLKDIQRWILDNVLYRCRPSIFAKGFVPGKSILDNARFHLGQHLVLSLDVQDFFGSIRAPRIFRLFERIGYCKPLAMLFTRLCTLNEVLPQGAPTSPALSNLISIRLDKRLGGYAKKQGLRYTRYADDMTFSGDLDPASVIKLVRVVLEDEGMRLNESKTRLMHPHNRQETTGIIVNTSKMQAPRSYRRRIRQEAYYIAKYGLDGHMQFTGRDRANYLNHLRGKSQFVLNVNRSDRDATRALELLASD